MEDSRSAGQGGGSRVCFSSLLPPSLPACPVQPLDPPHLSLLIMPTGREAVHLPCPWLLILAGSWDRDGRKGLPQLHELSPVGQANSQELGWGLGTGHWFRQ